MFKVSGAVRLHKGEARRIRSGHLWIFKSEIASFEEGIEPGDLVWVIDEHGRKLGVGAANPATVICVRLLTRGAKSEFTPKLLEERLIQAIGRRSHLGCDARRLVNAEGDLLPGLIVDIYKDVVVVQLQIAAWDRRWEAIVDILKRLLEPRAIVLRNDSKGRITEGLDTFTSIVFGRIDENVIIEESSIKVEVDVLKGNKTGYYIDQRDNRHMILPFVRNKKVLDCFCYTGTWSIMCARAGAGEVHGIDISRGAIELATRNARRNDVRINFEVGDVFDELPAIARREEKFDVIILDPPSLAARRRSLRGALRGYIHLNRLAMALLNPGGILLTCSCSHHVTQSLFDEILQQAASLVRRQIAVIARGGQPHDHPALLAMPETTYLKCLLLRLI